MCNRMRVKFYLNHFSKVASVSLLLAPVLNASGSEIAIESDGVVANIEVLDSTEAEQERLKKRMKNKPPPYVDKVMDDSSLEALDSTTEAETSEPSDVSKPTGFRSWFVESRSQFSDSAGNDRADSAMLETGLNAEYRFETRDYGVFSIQAATHLRDEHWDMNADVLSSQSDTTGSRLTLNNTALPITGGVLADVKWGDTRSGMVDVLNRARRVSLGSATIRGVNLHLYADELGVWAGSGKLGSLEGSPYPGFSPKQGMLDWFGFRRAVDGEHYIGFQFNRASGIPLQASDLATDAASEDIFSTAAAVGLSDPETGRYGQMLVLQSRTPTTAQTAANNANGIYIDAGFDQGRYKHRLGVWFADPDLYFGSSVIASNNRGGYWSADFASARWTINGAINIEQSNPEYADGDVRRERLNLNLRAQKRLGRHRTLGGHVQISQKRSDNQAAQSQSGSRSVRAGLNYQTRLAGWGHSLYSLSFYDNEPLVDNAEPASGESLKWEQSWGSHQLAGMPVTFNSSLGLAHDRSEDEQFFYPTAAVTAQYQLDADWRFNANLSYTSRHGNLSTSQGVSGSLSSEYKLGRNLNLGAMFSVNEARINLDQPVAGTTGISRSRDRYGYIYLNWRGNAGKSFQSIGVRRNGQFGQGEIVGTVFADTNKDALKQMDEVGVAGVEVQLDGRYVTKTDQQGQFRFHQVATGKHTLRLTPNTVPLPWSYASDKGVDVEVPLRNSVTMSIPLERLSD